MVSRMPDFVDDDLSDTGGSPSSSNIDGLNLECHKESQETSMVYYQAQAKTPYNASILGAAWLGVRARLHTYRNPIRWLLTMYITWLALSGTMHLAHLGHFEGLQNPFSRSNPIPQDSFSPDYTKLISLQSQLQRAMETSTSTMGVAIDLKRSEVAVRDLVTLVKLSDLVSRDRLTINLQQFVEDAKSTGRSLQKFGSHVGSAVDQTIGMNEYTIGLLESAAKPRGSSKSSKALQRQIPLLESEEIKAMWFEAIGTMKSNVAQLIVEAAANEQALNRLDGELSVINDMSAREDRRVSADKVETLNQLWTSLGGNKGQLAQFEHHTELLKNILSYRKDAAEHVNGALFQLERLALDLQDLNDQVTAPLLGKETQVPLEVHIRVMQQGTARLLEARAREREREDGYIRKVLGDN